MRRQPARSPSRAGLGRGIGSFSPSPTPPPERGTVQPVLPLSPSGALSLSVVAAAARTRAVAAAVATTAGGPPRSRTTLPYRGAHVDGVVAHALAADVDPAAHS
jgi:hypothetical protein